MLPGSMLLGSTCEGASAWEYVGIPRDFLIEDILSIKGGVSLVRICALECGGG